MVALGSGAVLTFAQDVAIWNELLRRFVLDFPKLYAGSSVIMYDPVPLFNSVSKEFEG